MEAFLNYGADPSSKDSNGSTALHRAAGANRLAVVDMLLSYESEFSLKRAEEMTPLLIAAVNGYEHIVEVLLEAGVGTEQRDADGRTTLD